MDWSNNTRLDASSTSKITPGIPFALSNLDSQKWHQVPNYRQEFTLEQVTFLSSVAPSENIFNLGFHSQNLSDNEVNKFIVRLMGSIDIDTLLQVYFAELKQLLPVVGLSVQLDQEMIHIGNIANKKIKKTLSCTIKHREFAKITYFTQQSLTLYQTNTLQSLHHFFKMSLFNALEHRQVKRLATKDHLTSLGNRAAFDDAINKLMGVTKRSGSPFALLVLDLNKFKAVNDTYGHLQGDQILLAFSQVLVTCLRDTDQAFRFGGDEFCCLLFDAQLQNINLIVDRIHDAVEHDPMLKKYKVTSSVGHACYKKGESIDDLFERADKALYADKKQQRLKAAS